MPASNEKIEQPYHDINKLRKTCKELRKKIERDISEILDYTKVFELNQNEENLDELKLANDLSELNK